MGKDQMEQHECNEWLTYKFCLYLIYYDFVYTIIMVGSLISDMGILLTFFYMSGWVTNYSPTMTEAKEVSALVASLSLFLGAVLGLGFQYLADYTKTVASVFYLSFILRAAALLIISTFGAALSTNQIIVCFVSLETGNHLLQI